MIGQSPGEANIGAASIALPLPGARESNAGDAFHVLWAARRAVQLLDPHAKLQRVVMEGVTTADGVAVDNDLFLGVDFTEYYEGDDFASAAAVVVAQLKYSTRHPNRPWSASRLCAATRRSAQRQGQVSVIRRLADVYKGYLAQAPRKDLLQKLTIQLVSNQPLEDGFAATLSAAQSFLRKAGIATAITTAALL